MILKKGMNVLSRLKAVFIFIILSMLVFVVTACGILPEEEGELVPPLLEPEKVTYKTIEAELGTIEDSVMVRGVFVPTKTKEHYFRYRSGKINKVYVKLGSVVKKGDLLADLINDEILKDINNQELEVGICKDDYDTAQKIADIEIKLAEDKLKELEKSVDSKKEMSSIYTKSDLEEAIDAHEQQKLFVEKTKLNQESILKSKKNSLDRAQLKLTELQEEFRSLRLIAENDGVVSYVKKLKEGDLVNQFEIIISIVEDSDLQFEYKGNKSSEFKLGMEVDITVKSKDYKGKVVLNPASVPVENRDLEEYKQIVRFELLEMPEGVKIGDYGDLKLSVNISENTVVILKSAVHKFQGSYIVYVLEDGLKVERFVKTGIENNRQSEILEGINPGDLVIVE